MRHRSHDVLLRLGAVGESNETPVVDILPLLDQLPVRTRQALDDLRIADLADDAQLVAQGLRLEMGRVGGFPKGRSSTR
jgi:hypothetical protein